MYLRYILLFVYLFFGCNAPVERKPIPFVNEKGSATYEALISDIIDDFRSSNRVAISGRIAYPLRREYPLPSIQNKEEMLNFFADIFDDELMNLIANSDVDQDWDTVGYRGIMFGNGLLWIDQEGHILAVNHLSKKEKIKRNALISKDRLGLHPSLQQYLEPILYMVTSEYQIRIDKMTDSTFRFASWKPDASMASKPDLIIDNGQRSWQGSGGNHSFTFIIGNYTYICGIQEMGLEDFPGELTVLKNNQEILVQPIKILRY